MADHTVDFFYLKLIIDYIRHTNARILVLFTKKKKKILTKKDRQPLNSKNPVIHYLTLKSFTLFAI